MDIFFAGAVSYRLYKLPKNVLFAGPLVFLAKPYNYATTDSYFTISVFIFFVFIESKSRCKIMRSLFINFHDFTYF